MCVSFPSAEMLTKRKHSEVYFLAGSSVTFLVLHIHTQYFFFSKFVNFHTSLIAEVLEELSALKIYNHRPTVDSSYSLPVMSINWKKLKIFAHFLYSFCCLLFFVCALITCFSCCSCFLYVSLLKHTYLHVNNSAYKCINIQLYMQICKQPIYIYICL